MHKFSCFVRQMSIFCIKGFSILKHIIEIHYAHMLYCKEYGMPRMEIMCLSQRIVVTTLVVILMLFDWLYENGCIMHGIQVHSL